ncbi:hypothetical protein MASR2M17_17290 [Aminivibrio sp.]
MAQSIGYDIEELATRLMGHYGLSCGNCCPCLRCARERSLDLGSGGGFDVFIAGRKVGPAGRAIGVDMTPEMVSKARRTQFTESSRN